LLNRQLEEIGLEAILVDDTERAHSAALKAGFVRNDEGQYCAAVWFTVYPFSPHSKGPEATEHRRNSMD